jgi:hypothetical protein
MKKCGILLILSLALLLGWKNLLMAKEVGEYHVKAIFLLNLAHFVNWPEESQTTDAPFAICIYGPDPFGSFLDRAVAGESILNRPITIEHYTRLSDLSRNSCGILFFNSSVLPDWELIYPQVINRPVLTVGDSVGFTQMGGMVNLLETGQRIQIQVNYQAVLKSGLSMSAKLLNLAHIVE